jgi:hypothetical protein
MKTGSALRLVAGSLLLVGCRSEVPPPGLVVEADSASLARARQAAGSLGQQMLGGLTAAMERGGPEEAIGFCADSAQVWSARHQAEGVAVRRTSLRIRNPANRPDSIERRILERLAAAHASNSLPQEYRETIVDESGTPWLQLVRPVVLQQPCLACHGDPAGFSEDVRRVLAARYPDDSATGYAVGDLRGMVSVRMAIPR